MVDGSGFDLRKIPQHGDHYYGRCTGWRHRRIPSHGYACMCCRLHMRKADRRSNQRSVPSVAEHRYDFGIGYEQLSLY